MMQCLKILGRRYFDLTLAKKLALPLIIAIFISSTGFSFFFHHDQRAKLETALQLKAKRTTYLVLSSTLESIWEVDLETLERNCRAFFEDNEISSLTVTDTYHGNDVLVGLSRDNGGSRDIVKSAFFQKNGAEIARLDIIFSSYYVERSLARMRNSILGLFLMVFFLLLTIIVIVSHITLKPLIGLTTGVERLTEGSFSFRIPVRSRDELGQLTVAFNNMAGEIHNYQNNLQQLVDRRTAELTVVNKRLLHEVEERKRSEIAADSANRAKSTFLAHMSHEIRTPLNAVINLSKHLLDKEIETEHLSEIRIIKNSGDHLLTVINDILDISKIESGELTLQCSHFDIVDTVSSTVESLALFAEEKDLYLTLDIAGGINRFVYGDESRLRQIFYNLINNAIKFTTGGGVVFSVFCSRKSEGCFIYTFSVKDTGIGIDEEDLGRLFERFRRVDNKTTRKHEGAGLGLAISKELVELMGGRIEVESSPGIGTVFTFSAVLKEGDETRVEENGEIPVAEGLSLAGLDILMAEDNRTNAEVVEILFEGLSVNLTCVENGVEVLETLNNKKPDVILMDLEMPGMDGFEASRRIRRGEGGEGNRSVPIIALSAHSTRYHERKALKAGANAYIAKPIDFQRLISCIHSLAGHGGADDDPGNEQRNTEPFGKALRTARFVKLFLDEIPEMEKAFLYHISASSFEGIVSTAHKHKSSSGLLGYDDVYELLGIIERNAVNRDMNSVYENFGRLKQILDHIKSSHA